MAQLGKQGIFCCPICLDFLKDPVTPACGHSYCRSCIQTYWDSEEERGVFSCPQCDQTFRSRPELQTNIMLAGLMEELGKTGLQAADQLPQQGVEALRGAAGGAMDPDERLFTQTIRELQRRSSEVKKQIRSQQETEERQIKELQEKLEQEITELKRRDAELEQLGHTKDHILFLKTFTSLPTLGPSTRLSRTTTRPLRLFEDLTAAVSQASVEIQDILGQQPQPQGQPHPEAEPEAEPEPEPVSRADFLRYSKEITLDLKTANKHLILSNGNREVKCVKRKQSYPPDPDRFHIHQVMSCESLTGRCYWEVEWSGMGVGVAVSYKNLSRAGGLMECFGRNDKSWMLECCKDSSFYHNNIQVPVPSPGSRVGVYLDQRAGILCFYRVSDTMTLIYRAYITFTQPLHVGLCLHRLCYSGSKAKFCKL